METVIKLNSVSVIKSGKSILDKIDLQIRRGENWAVIGPNGSGKSFLLRILSTLQYPSSGEAEIFGKILGRVNVWELRKNIGVVSDLLQREYKGEIKVFDVVCSGFFSSVGVYDNVTEEQKERAWELLEQLEITHLAERTLSHLSHGEQRKALIARALVFKPQLLILDEPCTGLDIPSREEFLESLQELIASGINIVLVTHHIEELMPEINKVLLLKEGKVYLKGDKRELMNRANLNHVLGHELGIGEHEGRYFTVFGPEVAGKL